MTKKLSCTSIKVMGRSHVLAEMRLSVLEQGEEIAWKVYTDMYNRNSDWSEADPLVQQICHAVFGLGRRSHGECIECGQLFDVVIPQKYCGLVCLTRVYNKKKWQKQKADPEQMERHRQRSREYAQRKRDESQREPDSVGH